MFERILCGWRVSDYEDIVFRIFMWRGGGSV